MYEQMLTINLFLLYKSEHQQTSCFKAKRKKRERICNIIQALKQQLNNAKFASKRRDFHEKLQNYEKS